MQLFYVNDILEMRDKSQWEIVEVIDDTEDFCYVYENLSTGRIMVDFEPQLNKKAIVVKMADIPEERPKCKVYYMSDYRRKKSDSGNEGTPNEAY